MRKNQDDISMLQFPWGKLALATAVLTLATAACGVGSVDNATATSLSSASAVAGQTDSDGPSASSASPSAATPETTPNPTTAPGATTPKTAPAPATFTGTVKHKALSPASAIFAVATADDGTQTLAVKISDRADDCADVTNNVHHANSNSFWLRVVGPTFADTSFQWVGESSDNGASTATFYALNNTCTDTLSEKASSAIAGRVTFANVGAQTASGAFSATMGTQGDKISGTFSATLCPALAALITAPDTVRTCE